MKNELRGILIPFRRDRKRDFASGSGNPLVTANVTQVLATECDSVRSSGELPWRTAFGTPLATLRHVNNDDALTELARVYSRDALRLWLDPAPSVEVLGRSDENRLVLRIVIGAAAPNRSGLPDEIEVAL